MVNQYGTIPVSQNAASSSPGYFTWRQLQCVFCLHIIIFLSLRSLAHGLHVRTLFDHPMQIFRRHTCLGGSSRLTRGARRDGN